MKRTTTAKSLTDLIAECLAEHVRQGWERHFSGEPKLTEEDCIWICEELERRPTDAEWRAAGIRDMGGRYVGVTGTLRDYETGEAIRPSTVEERDDSVQAAEHDGGAGVILVDGRRCYVDG